MSEEKDRVAHQTLYESLSQVLKNIERLHVECDLGDFSTFSDDDVRRMLYDTTTVEIGGEKYSVGYDRGFGAIVWRKPEQR